MIPALGRSPGEGVGNPLQYSCLECRREKKKKHKKHRAIMASSSVAPFCLCLQFFCRPANFFFILQLPAISHSCCCTLFPPISADGQILTSFKIIPEKDICKSLNHKIMYFSGVKSGVYSKKSKKTKKKSKKKYFQLDYFKKVEYN